MNHSNKPRTRKKKKKRKPKENEAIAMQNAEKASGAIANAEKAGGAIANAEKASGAIANAEKASGAIANAERSEVPVFKAKPSSKKKAVTVASFGMVSGVVKKEYVSPVKGARGDARQSEMELITKLGPNFQLDIGVIRNVHAQCKYDAEKAFRILVEYSVVSTHPSIEEDTQSVLESTVLFEDEKADWTDHLPEKDNVWRHSTLEPEQASSSDTTNWTDVVKKQKKAQGKSAQTSPNSAQTFPNKGDEYQVMRASANKLWDLAKSSKERTHYDRAREADEQACQDIFIYRNKSIVNTISLDLHGLHVKEAIKIVKAHLAFAVRYHSVRWLLVITGYGVHSNGTSKLRQSVVNLLQQGSIVWWPYKDNPGLLVIRVDENTRLGFLGSDSDSE